MSIIKSVILLLCLVMITGCKPRKSEKTPENIQEPTKSSLSGDFTISGAFALYPLVQKWADDFLIIHPDVKIKVLRTGTGQGIADLIEKKVQLVMISRPLTVEEKEAGLWVLSVAKDGVAPIVNQNNPYLRRIINQGLSPDEFQKLFTSQEPVKWADLLDTTGLEKAVVFTREDESGAADVMAGFFFKKATDLRGIKVTGDEEMIKNVQQNPLAIGFCNFSFAFTVPSGERKENIQVVPFDLDYDNKINRKELPFENLEIAHRSIWLGIYPETLCRELTIGSIGKPSDPAIKEFLKYVLTEGQESVKELGICELNNIYIRIGLESLE